MAGLRHPRGLIIGFIFLCICALPASAQMHRNFADIGTRNINNGVFGYPNQFTQTQEFHQGSTINLEIRRKLIPSAQTDVAAYVQRLADEICLRSDYTGQVQVQLIRNQGLLAFATMGGYCYIDEEVFRIAQNESELAGVLAHEIGHLAARHSAENFTRNQLLQTNPAWINTLFRPFLAIRGYVSGWGVTGFWKAVRYSNEIEADELATQYLWNSGFDPEGLANFLIHVRDQNWLDQPPSLRQSASNPPISVRRRRMGEVLKTLPVLPAVRLDSSSFAEARARLRPNFAPLSKK